MNYVPYNVALTNIQKQNIAKAITNKAPIKIKLGKNMLTGNDVIGLTNRQIKHLEKSKLHNKGAIIELSKRQLSMQIGSGFLDFLKPIVSAIGGPIFKNIVTPLATGFLTGAAESGAKKLVGSGCQCKNQNDSILVPNDKIYNLVPHIKKFNPKQRSDILHAYTTGSGLKLKLTKKQHTGGFIQFLAPLLASLVPSLLGIGKGINIGKGKGLQIGPASGHGLRKRTKSKN